MTINIIGTAFVIKAVSYAADPSSGKTVEHPAFEAYTLYTSDDLVNWKYEGDVATLETLVNHVWLASRCGVVYNEKANKYVLVSQFNGTIIASADNPKGPFKTEKGYFGVERHFLLSQMVIQVI